MPRHAIILRPPPFLIQQPSTESSPAPRARSGHSSTQSSLPVRQADENVEKRITRTKQIKWQPTAMEWRPIQSKLQRTLDNEPQRRLGLPDLADLPSQVQERN